MPIGVIVNTLAIAAGGIAGARGEYSAPDSVTTLSPLLCPL